MTKYTYELEQRDEKTWMVYKVNFFTQISEVGYQVELDSHAPGAHQCSCPFGVMQKDGQTAKFCRHVQMILETQKTQETKIL